MLFNDSFFLEIKGVDIAHEHTLYPAHKWWEVPKVRGHYGLVYAISGSAEYHFSSGETVVINEGNALFLPPYASYSILIKEEFRHYTINFDAREDTLRLGMFDKLFCLFEKEDASQLQQKFKRIVTTWTAKKLGFEMETVGYLYGLLSILYSEYANRQYTAPHQRLLSAKEYIEQNFDRPVSLEELANLSNMSVTNFRREWKKIYSESPLQYHISIRFYYAKEYLTSGYYTVSEIAQKCGFDDVSYFVRFFKRQAGLTPGEYKKQILGFD